MYANVQVEYPVKELDKTFTYKVPKDMQNTLKVGMNVYVPFGKSNIHGVVLSFTDKAPEYETKDIYRIENPDIRLTEEQLKIGEYLQRETLCTLISAFQTMLPPALKIKDQKHNYIAYDTFLKLNIKENEAIKYINEHPRAKRKIDVIETLLETKMVNKKVFPIDAVRSLLKENIICEEHKRKYRINAEECKEGKKELNDEQKNAFVKVTSCLDKHQTFLLQGVTGSGKTEVYMQIIEEVIKKGKTAIVLVPEICLTTQTVQRFYNRFGSQVAVFHSALSAGEKYDEYQKIYNNEVKIVVGTRSSVFVPLSNLGLIVIDEEHSDTYKQDVNPRYSAIDVALFRCKNNNIPLILASATPSLEAKARAMKGVYECLYLNKRASGTILPNIITVDMTQEIKKRNFIFSDLLISKMKNAIEKKEQVILLLNRRGFATFVNCSNCGFTYKCPNCDITLTFHKTTNNLRCHYCGYFIKKDDLCPKCHEDGLNYLGLGTQKLEVELLKILPDAKVVRMDQDTTMKKGSYQKIIDAFDHHEYDILLGTQMISKGLDFKCVTLVGVINADTSLNIPDFRANEKTFQLLYQTAGRCGRDKKAGEVVIQTYNPDNEVIKFTQNNDYEGFFRYEMNIRHKLKYPPYTYLIAIHIKSREYELASSESVKVKKMLTALLDNKTLVLGPSPAAMFKVNNIYDFQISIKYTFDETIKKTIKKIDEMYAGNKKINIEVIFNPSRY